MDHNLKENISAIHRYNVITLKTKNFDFEKILIIIKKLRSNISDADVAEAYLEASRTSTMKLFCENS